MSVDEESTFCYCLLEPKRCHVLLEQPGRYALMGAPLSQEAAKRLRLAVFGSLDTSNSLGFTLRVYCVDDTPHAFQVRRRLEVKFGVCNVALMSDICGPVFAWSPQQRHFHLLNVSFCTTDVQTMTECQCLFFFSKYGQSISA